AQDGAARRAGIGEEVQPRERAQGSSSAPAVSGSLTSFPSSASLARCASREVGYSSTIVSRVSRRASSSPERRNRSLIFQSASGAESSTRLLVSGLPHWNGAMLAREMASAS